MLKNLFYIFLLTNLILIACKEENDMNDLGLIPLPSKIEIASGKTFLDNQWSIKHNNNHKDLDDLKQLLTKSLNNHKITPNENSNKIISLIIRNNDGFNDEDYMINIHKDSIVIVASSPSGIFYGIQTFDQLLDSSEKSKNGFLLSNMNIVDQPRFKWRGMHLDVGRHFFDISFIKKYIDYIAMHKMNVFHWHLTEDQGWRIEINAYPKLTEIGAYRDETLIGSYFDKPHKYDGIKYGGFYTKKDIQEVIEYARKRYVTIIPEIEMPGHSLAALAAYPELSCTDKKHTVAKIWGVHKEIFCAGKESTFNFLETVLTEVAEMFPGPYIHIGGDEAPKDRWKKHALDQKRIIDENLKDEHELQSYFIKRIENILSKLGKRLIGWDEILEGGLAPDAIVQSWRGMDGGIIAANAKHEVIMSPTSHAYFDYYQSDDRDKEPLAIGGFLSLEKVYQFEPIPDDIEQEKIKYILGGQGNVWTEYINTPQKVEYMAIPRMSAMAEVLWSKKSDRDFESFKERMKWQYKRLDLMKVNYRKES